MWIWQWIVLTSARLAAAHTIAGVGRALIAEHSYFWVGVQSTARLGGGTVTTGEQMFVEYFAPAEPPRGHPLIATAEGATGAEYFTPTSPAIGRMASGRPEAAFRPPGCR